MNQLIKVSANSITNDAKKIEQLVSTIPELLSELEGALQELANCWEGVAWSTYQARAKAYMEMLTEIHKSMNDYTTKLGESSKIYHRTEQDICTTLSSVYTG